MTENQTTTGRRWLWLAAPLAISSLGWTTLPLLLHAASDSNLEGAYYVAISAGIVSTALTAPVTSVVLAAIQQRCRLGMLVYVAIVLAVASPALAFQSIVVSGSAMPLVLGNWVMRMSPGVTPLWFAATFLALYIAIGIVTYPFSRRGGFSAAIAAIAAGTALLGCVIYRVWFAA